MNSEYSSPQLQAHFLELERVLERVECASTLYQVLALKRAATTEDMKRAYQQTVTLLNPSDKKHRHLDPGLQARIKRALNKVANAFSVLTNFGKRVEYDNSLVNRDRVPLSLDVPDATKPKRATKPESADVKQPADFKQPADVKQPADFKQPADVKQPAD